MSFIVSFQGQFRPYRLPDSHGSQAKSVNEGDRLKNLKDHEDDDFENVLAQKKGLEGSDNKRRDINKQKELSAYKRQEDHARPSKLAHAKDIMSSPVYFLRDTDSLSKAKEELEKKKFRHFPILNKDDVLCGIISDRDILKNDGNSLRIAQIMRQEVLTALEDTYVNDLARIMLFEKIHSLPILNSKRQVSGIVTNTDVLRLMSNQPHFDFKV